MNIAGSDFLFQDCCNQMQRGNEEASQTRVPLLHSGFRLRPPALLTAAKRLKLLGTTIKPRCGTVRSSHRLRDG